MSGILKNMWCCGAKGFSPESEMMRREDEESISKEGYIRVNVGKEFEWKLEMEADLLNHPFFEDLLRVSEEEFGFSYDGALRMACDVQVFEHLIHLVKATDPSAHPMQLSDLLPSFHSEHSHPSSPSSSS